MLTPLLQLMSDGARENFISALQRVQDEEPISDAQRQVDAYNQAAGSPSVKEKTGGYHDEYFHAVDCPDCKNKYFVAVVKDDVCVLQECACCLKRKSIVNAKKSGLVDLLDKKLNDFVATEEWQKSMRDKAILFIRDGESGWFGAFGQSGAGKTHICAAICNKLLVDGRRVKYLKWVSFARRIERIRFDDRRDQEFSQYANADVLYIDDLLKGANLNNATEVALALELIERRMSKRGGCTLISGELVPAELARIDEALAGRIVEKCGKYLVSLPKDTRKNYRLR